MIEVSLYSVPTGSDVNVSMGKCLDRVRYDKEKMGTGVMSFVKGFLKANIQSIEPALGNNKDITEFITSDTAMTTKDLASINYFLAKGGLLVKVVNVTEDEENPTGPSAETAEWNIIDYNFIQNEYPTAVKIIPGTGMDVVSVLKQVVDNSDLFDPSKFGEDIKNPLKETVRRLELAKEKLGRIEPGLATKIYEILEQTGFKVFLATGE
jgi:hypothetical protein